MVKSVTIHMVVNSVVVELHELMEYVDTFELLTNWKDGVRTMEMYHGKRRDWETKKLLSVDLFLIPSNIVAMEVEELAQKAT